MPGIFFCSRIDAISEALNARLPRYRTYLPNKISYVLELWRAEVDKVNKKVGQSLADPEKYDNLFPGFHDSIKTQQYLLREKQLLPASDAVEVSRILIVEAREKGRQLMKICGL